MEKRKMAQEVPIPQESVEATREDLRSYRNGPWFKEGAWSISHHNFQEATKPPTTSAKSAVFIDITGRVIEQVPGVALTTDEKLTLAGELADAGVPEMHVATFIENPEDQEHVRAIASSGIPIRIVQLIWTLSDIAVAAEAGAHVAEIAGQGRPSLFGGYGEGAVKTQEQVIARSREKVQKAKALGLKAQAVINGIGFTDISYLPRFTEAMVEAGADSIYFADGPAGLGPRATHYLMSVIKKHAGTVKTGLHVHNDFGLGLANALAAFEAGAEIFDVSINGLGERAGQVDLAQLAVVLKIFYGVDTGIHLERLTRLSRLAEDFRRETMPTAYPIVGRAAFTDAVGLVQKLDLYIDEQLHLPIAPQLVGGERSYPQGRHTGAFGLIYRAERSGFAVPEDEVQSLLKELDRWFETRKRELSDVEFVALIKSHGAEMISPKR